MSLFTETRLMLAGGCAYLVAVQKFACKYTILPFLQSIELLSALHLGVFGNLLSKCQMLADRTGMLLDQKLTVQAARLGLQCNHAWLLTVLPGSDQANGIMVSLLLIVTSTGNRVCTAIGKLKVLLVHPVKSSHGHHQNVVVCTAFTSNGR